MKKFTQHGTLLEVILDYEIRSSWWASWISNEWLQELSANWFAWKVRRKFARWQRMRGES